jgi:hypothetical protein
MKCDGGLSFCRVEMKSNKPPNCCKEGFTDFSWHRIGIGPIIYGFSERFKGLGLAYLCKCLRTTGLRGKECKHKKVIKKDTTDYKCECGYWHFYKEKGKIND